MKKTICLLTAILILIAVLSGCGSHEHIWVDANCDTPKTCSECGETEGEALGHKWVDASCSTPMTCSVCGTTSGSPLEHTWKDATCTESKTCTVCGTIEGEPLGHEAPDLSCINGGTCTRCGEVISALGHDWMDATCTEPQICSRCGVTDGESLGHTVASGTCSRCGIEVYETVSGSGDDVLTDITVGDGIYKVHFTNSGGRNFIVWVYDSSGDKDLAVNTVGSYDGYYFLMGNGPFIFEIESSGSWTYTVEKIGYTNETSFSGQGAYVTEMFSASSGKWHITHDGNSNFVVWLWTTDGRDLLVNEIGRYDGNRLLSIPSKSNALLVIEADGNWTADPSD